MFELQNENIHLKEEVEQLKLRLVDLETMLGSKFSNLTFTFAACFFY